MKHLPITRRALPGVRLAENRRPLLQDPELRLALLILLIAILAVVLTGKGIAGLQEAGLLAVDPWHGVPRIALLGIFPTAQGVLAQLAALAILIAGFGINRRMRRRIAR